MAWDSDGSWSPLGDGIVQLWVREGAVQTRQRPSADQRRAVCCYPASRGWPIAIVHIVRGLHKGKAQDADVHKVVFEMGALDCKAVVRP